MPSFKKTLVLVSILGGVFLPFFVNASIYPAFQNSVKDDKKTFFWFDDDTGALLNVFYATDTFDYFYWDDPSTHAHRIYLGTSAGSGSSTLASLTIPTTDYHFWILSLPLAGGNFFGYRIGDTEYQVYCNTINTIDTGEKVLYLYSCPGLAYSSGINTIFYSNGNDQIYFILYTNEDLSYINNKESLYTFLDNLQIINSIYASSTPGGDITLPPGTCDDLGTIAGALCRVITYLFMPSTSSLTQFSGLKDQLFTKAPFGYFMIVKNTLGSLNATSSPVFAFANMGAIQDDIFDPIKTGLTWILWIFFAFWFIKRIASFDF